MTKDIENEIQSWIAVRSFAVEDANPQAPIIDANELAEFVTEVFKKLEGCVVVPLENARYFSMDGENYEIHDNLVQAKDEAVRAIEYYSDRLADQQLDPRSDGNFQQISYGIVLAESSYSVDHIVTQQDIDDGEYSYEVGTEIMSLFLLEAARGGNEQLD